MNRIFLFILFLSVLFSCKNDVKESITDTTTTTAIETSKKTSKKRVIRAERDDIAEIEKKKQERISKKEQENKKKYREKLYEKNKALREKELQKKKNPKKKNELIDMGNGVKVQKYYDFAEYDLPSACDLLSPEWLSKEFNTEPGLVNIKDASSSRTKYAKSCFFKWDMDALPNGGIMLQIQRNPVPNISKKWVSSFMKAKKKEGESSMSTPGVMNTYKELSGLGDEAIYNFDLNRCFWRVGEDYLFMLAFNLDLEEKKEKALAIKIGNEVIRNFNKINK